MSKRTWIMLAALALVACGDDGMGPESGADYEVWLVDQSNSAGLAHGGTLYVYDGAALVGANPSAAQPTATINLGLATTQMCLTSTGAAPVRPHMLDFNSNRSHAILSFVASGHVVIFNAVSRAPVACLRSSAGAGGARQAHAAFVAPDDSYILVANQNGKLLERIDANFTTNTYTLNSAATLNLLSCTTPSGALCESAALRPDNAPICPVIDPSGNFGFVTLRGGGLLVVNPKVTPMSILAEYDRNAVHGNGCGGIATGGKLYITSGGGTATNLHEFDVYKFTMASFSATTPSTTPNAPAVSVVFSDDAGAREAHGMTLTGDGRYLWVGDRVGNVIEVFDVQTDTRVGTVNLVFAGTSDPAPDLLDVSPRGERVFAALRGPIPLSGDAQVATGNTPGLMVLEVQDGGRNAVPRAVVRITNLDVATERADAHGIQVRRK